MRQSCSGACTRCIRQAEDLKSPARASSSLLQMAEQPLVSVKREGPSGAGARIGGRGAPEDAEREALESLLTLRQIAAGGSGADRGQHAEHADTRAIGPSSRPSSGAAASIAHAESRGNSLTGKKRKPFTDADLAGGQAPLAAGGRPLPSFRSGDGHQLAAAAAEAMQWQLQQQQLAAVDAWRQGELAAALAGSAPGNGW